MRTGKLNARKVATVKPGKYGDGGGLWLYVGPNSRSWVYRYMIVGKAREMGLGSFGNVTLEEARELARQHRRRVHQKPESGGPVDPLHERQAAEIRAGPRADVPAGGRRLSGRQQGFVEKRKAPSAMEKYTGAP